MEVFADRTKRAAAHYGVGGAPGQRRGAGNHVAGTEGQVIGKDDVAGRVAQCPRTGFHVGGNGDDVLHADAIGGGAAVRADVNEGAARDGEPVGVAVQGTFGTRGMTRPVLSRHHLEAGRERDTEDSDSFRNCQYSGEFVLEPGNVSHKLISGKTVDGKESTEWIEF